MVCRGDVAAPPDDVRLQSIDAGDGAVCGVRASDSRIICWGRHRLVSNQQYRAVSYGREFMCGLQEDGVARCNTTIPDKMPPEHERFVSISVSAYTACGLRDDGYAVCWGTNTAESPEIGGFTAISAGTILLRTTH